LPLRWFYHFYAHLLPPKGLFEIAIAKADKPIRIFDQDHINLLLLNELNEEISIRWDYGNNPNKAFQ